MVKDLFQALCMDKCVSSNISFVNGDVVNMPVFFNSLFLELKLYEGRCYYHTLGGARRTVYLDIICFGFIKFCPGQKHFSKEVSC